MPGSTKRVASAQSFNARNPALSAGSAPPRGEQAPGGILWAAVVALAMRILATSDDDWGRWEPLAKAEASAGAQPEPGSVGRDTGP